MLGLFKKNIISLPYKVKSEDGSIIIEASGNYNESFLVFHAVIKCNNDIGNIYVHLNESITKEINLEIEFRDYKKFDFDFTGLLTDDEISSIVISDKKVLMEGTI